MSTQDAPPAQPVDASTVSATKEFNLVIGATVAIALTFLFVSALYEDTLAGMMAEDESTNSMRVPVWERYTMPYETAGDYGVALEVGPYELLATENAWNSTHHFVEYLSLIHI